MQGLHCQLGILGSTFKRFNFVMHLRLQCKHLECVQHVRPSTYPVMSLSGVTADSGRPHWM